MKTLLDVANKFVETIDYYIKKDLNAGDVEGSNLKELTKLQVQSIISENPEIDDGRPCPMDVFASHLVEECDDYHDLRDAINEWNHGDWEAALSYLKPKTRKALQAGKE